MCMWECIKCTFTLFFIHFKMSSLTSEIIPKGIGFRSQAKVYPFQPGLHPLLGSSSRCQDQDHHRQYLLLFQGYRIHHTCRQRPQFHSALKSRGQILLGQELFFVLCCKFDTFPFSKCRRIFSEIHSHIINSSL